MSRHPAKVLAPAELRRVLAHVQTTRMPTRNRVMVLLSFKAGLRAAEIAGLTWPMILTAGGAISPCLSVSPAIAKMHHGRRIPMHPELLALLRDLHRQQGRPRQGPVMRSERGGAMTARSVVNWFKAVYVAVGLEGCSSHSGRRTFITQSARHLAKAGASLRDVQELAGHRALSTTERYIQGDRDLQRKLVSLL
ncbi:Tyrosine recombinase XerD (plasmid) [Paracoccus marcusii]|uniref:tyrosine-type recombinase/integrase n=1 Tax=Paracoccus marcusii TaxID=59779 RepID=UPI001C3DE506|nr:site-specific integrase [Paracoccus marcusii]QXI66106.1 Tyrosine recombinase XerD [Paracoccus marcusii]